MFIINVQKNFQQKSSRNYLKYQILVRLNLYQTLCKKLRASWQKHVALGHPRELNDMSPESLQLKDDGGWQFLTIEAAETLCMVCLPPDEHIY